MADELAPITKLEQLMAELDLHPRLMAVYERLYETPVDEWDEGFILAIIRNAFGAGMVARQDKKLMDSIRAMGFKVDRS